MHSNVSKRRFAPKFYNVWAEDASLVKSLATFFDMLRRSALKDFLTMHGTHGPAAAARALLDARAGDNSDFNEVFILLARELTSVLEVATRTRSRAAGGADESLSVLSIVKTVDRERTAAVTAWLDRVLARSAHETRREGGRKRNSASLGEDDNRPAKSARAS